MARMMEIVTPLGEDLLFHRMRANEEMSRLGEYEIDLLSKKSDIDLDQILAKNVTVKLELPDQKTRYFNGFVTRFLQVGMHGKYHLYHATVRPWLWFLTRTINCRIFQEMSVPDIVKKIFEPYPMADFKFDLSETYVKRTYCVQYRETDFNFISRLMEDEGIYYFFKHVDGRHTLNAVDSGSSHSPFPGYAELPYIALGRSTRLEKEFVDDWNLKREVQPGHWTLDDFDFERPSVDLTVDTKKKRNHEHATFEVYDYPGEYFKNDLGDHYVRTRMDEWQYQFELVSGGANARGITVGSLFKLTGHPRKDQNVDHLVLSSEYELEYHQYEALDATETKCHCRFTGLDTKQQFRPQRTSYKTFVQGPQTAIVVGPSGDEIYTDKYGRVKVQFHWDREGKEDENSSCWIRVAHPWAGKNWGMVAIPRMGQEVVVDFLEGDPDRPLITGRVYNAEQMPPWDLPANATQTGILSRSSKGGGYGNANAIRFEDKKGSEQVWLHAEKNQDIEVENDETHWVGHDRKKTIDHDETTLVKHDRTETVDNNETITVHGMRTETVDKNETITIHQNRTETVDLNEKIAIGVNRTENVGANETITIGANRTISVGASETATVALQRTHAVGINETIAIGAAQEVAIGAMQSITVGANQSTSVGANQSNTIGAKQSTSVGASQDNTIGADRKLSVAGAQTTSVGKARTTSVAQDDKLTVGKNLVISAADSVSITTGSASITMKKDGTITINGKDITIDGSGKINVKASSDIVMKGSKILQN